MNIKQTLNWANIELKKANVSEPEASALVLLGDVLGMSRTEILAHPEKKLPITLLNRFRRYVGRRKKHESVWHIIGKVEFMGLSYVVNKNVLVPRPETELLVAEVIKNLEHPTSHLKPIAILDVGTGSGTIAIALVDKLKTQNSKLKIIATDISSGALRVARKNAKQNGVSDKIKFIKADLFPKTSNLSPLTFNRIVANLPYIPSEEIKSLAVDVHHYEPKVALDGGKRGLETYERFLSKVGNYLKPNGMIFCEIGINQGEPFKKLVKKYFPKAKVKILGDLAGIDRIAIITTSNK